jgi:hypothetical protein
LIVGVEKYTDAQIEDVRFGYPGLSHARVAVLTGVNVHTVRSVRKGRRRVAFRKGDWKEEHRSRRGESLRLFFIHKACGLIELYLKRSAEFELTGEFDEPKERELYAGGVEGFRALKREHGRLGTAARYGGGKSRGDPAAAARDAGGDVAVADGGGAPGGGDGPRPADKPPPTVERPAVHKDRQGTGARDDAVPGVFYDRR